MRTVLWLIVLAALFGGAAVGGYYLVPTALLGSDQERVRWGDAPGPADAGADSADTSGQQVVLPAAATDALQADATDALQADATDALQADATDGAKGE
jgi:hypothetical protein